jgi:hypothetical protein
LPTKNPTTKLKAKPCDQAAQQCSAMTIITVPVP